MNKLYVVLADLRIIVYIGYYLDCIDIFDSMPIEEKWAVMPLELLKKGVYEWKMIESYMPYSVI